MSMRDLTVHMEKQRGGMAVCGHRSRSLTLDAARVTCERCRDFALIPPYPVHLDRAGKGAGNPVCGRHPAHELTTDLPAVTCTGCRNAWRQARGLPTV